MPAEQLVSLDSNPDVKVWRAKSSLFRFLIMDQYTDSPSDMTDNDGNPMTKNPFKDWRVRRAISLAINRDALIATALEGLGIPAGQLLDEGFSGVDPTLKPDPYDPKEARRLLAEAGYPDGFPCCAARSSGHYYNAPQVVETIGQMLARVGTRPPSKFIRERNTPEPAGVLNTALRCSAGASMSGKPAKPSWLCS